MLPSNTSWTANSSVVTSGGDNLGSLPVTIPISNSSFVPAPSAINLPVLRINTEGTPITSKTVDVQGIVTATSAADETTYLSDTPTFHVHGNTTSVMPKLPYHMKLAESTDLLAAMGVDRSYTGGPSNHGCDRGKSYILLANYGDKTLLQDFGADALGTAFAVRRTISEWHL